MLPRIALTLETSPASVRKIVVRAWWRSAAIDVVPPRRRRHPAVLRRAIETIGADLDVRRFGDSPRIIPSPTTARSPAGTGGRRSRRRFCGRQRPARGGRGISEDQMQAACYQRAVVIASISPRKGRFGLHDQYSYAARPARGSLPPAETPAASSPAGFQQGSCVCRGRIIRGESPNRRHVQIGQSFQSRGAGLRDARRRRAAPRQ